MSTEIVINDEYMNLLEEQFRRWADFLNMSFGFVSFTFALACLGTKTPAVNALFSLAVVVYIRYKGSHSFPSEMTCMRLLAKSDENTEFVLVAMQQKFLGSKTLFKDYFIFLFGFVLLAVIVFSPLLTPHLPLLGAYVNGI